MMARLVVLIEADERRGLGTPNDPVRLIKQWFTPDGTLVVERDDFLVEIAVENRDRKYRDVAEKVR